MEQPADLSPLDFYNRKQQEYTVALAGLSRRIRRVSFARVALALLFIAWLVWGRDWCPAPVVWSVAIALVAAFLALVKVHGRLFARRSYVEAAMEICRQEFRLSQYDFSGCDGGVEFFDATHDFTADLDIFGEKSLFAYINRTATEADRRRLADWLRRPLSDVASIARRQEAVRELAALPDLRLHFAATGRVSGEKRGDAETVGTALSAPVFPRSKGLFWAIRILPFVYLALALSTGVWPVAASLIGLLFAVCLVAALAAVKRVSQAQERLESGLRALAKYAPLIETLESASFSAPELRAVTDAFSTSSGEKASVVLRRLRPLMDNLNQRNNALVFLLLNGFLLWDFRQLAALDGWLRRYGREVAGWFDALAGFDALASLGAFAYNHPGYVYPEAVGSDRPVYEAEALGHPLIDPARCVCNPVQLPARPSFLIVTGANMAGKSTYLRAVGVNFVLAMLGAPVCAASMTFTPCTLFTGLHTTDSLAGNESYFFAELKRLRQVVLRQRAGEKCMVILDEILKGTNSVDKQTGSLALVRQLVSLGTVGAAATHDLVLGSLAEEFPGVVRAVCFESEIVDDALHFDYRLRPGVARHMNACFLMEQMDIIPRDGQKGRDASIG